MHGLFLCLCKLNCTHGCRVCACVPSVCSCCCRRAFHKPPGVACSTGSCVVDYSSIHRHHCNKPLPLVLFRYRSPKAGMQPFPICDRYCKYNGCSCRRNKHWQKGSNRNFVVTCSSCQDILSAHGLWCRMMPW